MSVSSPAPSSLFSATEIVYDLADKVVQQAAGRSKSCFVSHVRLLLAVMTASWKDGIWQASYIDIPQQGLSTLV